MQVRLGEFAGIAVAIKELLSAMWDPKCTQVSHHTPPPAYPVGFKPHPHFPARAHRSSSSVIMWCCTARARGDNERKALMVGVRVFKKKPLMHVSSRE